MTETSFYLTRAAWPVHPQLHLACLVPRAIFAETYNCGYVVAPGAQGQGIAAAMCEHSQREAVSLNFRAMQFNLVVATNERAIRLWQKLGFSVAGTLPRALHHQRLGFVDALVMYKELVT
jgi:ribosomal protein S18 acetylase RimI-like enzyme